MKNLLFLAHRIPYPPTKGDKLRSYHLLRHLAPYFHIHLGCFIDDPDDWQHVDTLRGLCADALFVPLRPSIARVRSFAALAGGESLSVLYYRDAGMRRWVESVVQQRSIECALVFSSVMAQYVENARKLRRIADFVDVDSQKWAQYAEDVAWPMSWLYRREARTLLAFERRVAESFDATVFVSKAEADLFGRLAKVGMPEKIRHAGNGVDTDYFDPSIPTESPFDRGTRALVFTGAMDYKPNVDAVVSFVRDVLPAIRERFPDVRFAIVGARPDPAVRALGARPEVLVTGTVADVRPYLAHASAVVAPLRIARGVQNKVLEGMAMARPVIASRAAAEGIDAEPGREILHADTAKEYLAAVQDVIDGAVPQLGQRAREKILKSYSWAANLDGIRALLDGPRIQASAAGKHAAAAA